MRIPFRGTGRIRYCEKEYQCYLYYSEEQSGIILKILVQSQFGMADFLEFPFDMSVVYGELDTGFKFAAINVRRGRQKDHIGNNGVSVFDFYPEYLIAGVSSDMGIEPHFKKLRFILSDIIEWGGESIYEIGEDSELKMTNDNVEKKLYEDEQFVIVYRVGGSYLPCVDTQLLCEKIELRQYGEIDITSKNGECNFNSFQEQFSIVNELIELSKLEKTNIEKVFAYSDEYVDKYEENIQIPREIKVIGKGIQANPVKQEKTGAVSFGWITLSTLLENKSFELYFEKHEKIHPVIDLFIEMLYVKNESQTRDFLNVVQALETYHSRFVTNSLAEFKKRVTDLTKDLPETNRTLLKKVLLANSYKFITLESRLADLLYAEGKKYFDIGDIRRDEFPGVVAHTRHYYIHYDEKTKTNNRIFTDNELSIYIRALFLILEYYILSEIGVDANESRINEKLRWRWGNISQDLSIQKAANERHNLKSED